eukprot:scaffold5608_cov145-Isochrysis_galbana.AAC.3
MLRACVYFSAVFGASAFSTTPTPEPMEYLKLIDLPMDTLPEGVVGGVGSTIFAGSRSNGRIFKVDTATGEVVELVAPLPATATHEQSQRWAVGLTYDVMTNTVFSAGGPSGEVRAFNADSGEMLGVWMLNVPNTAAGETVFINDCVISDAGVYVTNSRKAEMYLLPFGTGNALPAPNGFTTIPLTGQWEQLGSGNSANGIEALPDGNLLVINGGNGKLFKVMPSGEAMLISLTGMGAEFALTNGDGILLDGMELYVVHNRLNQVTVFKMAADFMTGTLHKLVVDDDFKVPTTIAKVEDRFYVVNARFGESPPLDYEIVHVTDLP